MFRKFFSIFYALLIGLLLHPTGWRRGSASGLVLLLLISIQFRNVYLIAPTEANPAGPVVLDSYPEVKGMLSQRRSPDPYRDVRRLWERWRTDRHVLYDAERPVSKDIWWVVYELEEINRSRPD